MKKTFLQMIAEIAPAPEALKNVGKQLVTKDGQKAIKGEYVTIIDPKTGEEKQIYRTEKGERSVAYRSAVAGYDKRYRKVIEKFQNDPAFKNQVSVIRKNNVFYLNRLYNLIKSQDPSIESLTQLFSKTKNDSEFFSYMNSFIVPLSSIWKISKKIEVGDLWDDENYKTDLTNNGFTLILPKNQAPTKFNVVVKWGDAENNYRTSIATFNQSMATILNHLQKFVDVEDKINAKGSVIKKLLDPIPQPQGNTQKVFYNETQMLNEIRDEKAFNELFDFLKLIQYKNESKVPVIGPNTLDPTNASKKIDVQISKLENEISVLDREYKSVDEKSDKATQISDKITALKGQIKFLENKKESYKKLGSNESKIVKMLMSNKSIDSFEKIFEAEGLLKQISDIYTSLNDIQTVYSGFDQEAKNVIDSSFIVSKFKTKRNNFIQNSKKVFKMVNDLEQFGLMMKILKDKISEAKESEVKLSDKVMDYEEFNENGGSNKKALTLSGLINKFSSGEMNDLLNRLVGIVVSFKSMLRTIGFIKLYDAAQYHTLLNVAEMNVDTDTSVDDYFVYVGIVPEDVIAQSTFQFWTSCQTLSGATDLNKYVGSGTLLGNIVCFLLALDWSKPTGGNRMKVVKAPIKHSAITDPDDIMSIKEFKELAAGGIRGTKKVEVRKFLRTYAIRPVARVLIKTFELDDMGRGMRTIKPESLMQGGSQEEIETIKFVDRLYTNKISKEAQSMVTSKGVARGVEYDKYSAIFYQGIQSLAKRLNINVKVGNYKLREEIYDDGTSNKSFSSAIKKYESGQKINFSRETTAELLELLRQDKNFLRYRTFRHALFSKEVVDGTLDLQGTEIESLDPMHPTNLPKYGRGLQNDKFENFDAIEWMVNDNFRKNSGNFDAPLTKSEEAEYGPYIKEAKADYEAYKKANPELEL